MSSAKSLRRSRYRTVARLLEGLERRLLLSAGDLDPSFGAGGKLLGATSDSIVDMAVQQDGDIVLLGSNANLYRFLPNGPPDLSFGTNGKVGPLFQDSQGVHPDLLLIGPDQNIVFVGDASTSIRLARFLPNGQSDPIFGNNGFSTLTLSKAMQFTAGIFGPSGQIVLAATSGSLIGLTSAGTFDGFFGTSGISPGSATALANAPNDTYFVFNNGSPATLRNVNTAGSTLLWTSNADSVVSIKGLPNTIGSATRGTVDVLPNGDILLNQPVLTRLAFDGSMDNTFGTNGQVARSGVMALQSDGKILLGWTDTKTWAGSQFAITRLNPNGSLDTSFGDNGTTEDSPFSNSQGTLQRMAVVPGDRNIAEGNSVGLTPAQTGLMALSPAGEHTTQIDFASDGSLVFTGNRVSETITISPGSNGGIALSDGNAISFEDSDLTALHINAMQGNDIILVNPGIQVPLFIDGGEGIDSISLAGSAGDDIVSADAANFSGTFGNITTTSIENRTFNGNDGNDSITLTAGTLTFNGGNGNDTASLTGGVLTFDGGPDNDAATATGGTLNFTGDDGVDSLTQAGGTFTFTGGNGNDTATIGGNTTGTFTGGANDDSLIVNCAGAAAPINVSFDTGAGNDAITLNGAPAGNSFGDQYRTVTDSGVVVQFTTTPSITLNGGPAADNFVLRNSDAAYIVNAGDGDDTLDVQFPAATLNGGNGNDKFLARDGKSQVIDGGAGNDLALVDSTDVVSNVEGIAGGSILGKVYIDANQNGTQDSGEGGPSGGDGLTSVYYDANGNGVLDPGEPSSFIASDGTFSINGAGLLPFANQQATLRLNSHAFTVTTPSSGAIPVAIPGLNDSSGFTFGVKPNSAVINGSVVLAFGTLETYTVYWDVNNNDILDAGEPSVSTDSQGKYSLSVLATGNVVLRVIVPHGYDHPNGDSSSLGISYGGTYTAGQISLTPQPILIEGTVFNDTDGNGLQGSSEAGIPGWQLFFDKNGDGVYFLADDGTRYTSSSTGAFVMGLNNLGTYSVVARPLPGWSVDAPTTDPHLITVHYGDTITGVNFALRQTGPNAIIQGLLFLDNNASGSYDSGDNTLFSSPVYLDKNDNGQYDRGDEQFLTDSTGHYTATVVPGQTAVIRYQNSSTSIYLADPPGGARVVTPSAGQTITGQDFGLAPATEAIGTLYNDLNGNDLLDAGEPKLAGWSVQLYLDNGSGTSPTLLTTATTNASGVFDVTGLPTSHGPVIALPVVPSGWVASLPAQAEVSTDFSPHKANFPAQGFTQSGVVTGTVFADNNGNGTFDAGDLALNGYTVYTDLNNNGVLDPGEPSSRSVSPNYVLGGLLPGTYVLRQVLPVGYIPKSPVSGAISVTIANPQRLDNVNFIDINPNTVSGTIFLDANGDLTRQAGESGASGVTVFLDTNGNNILDSGELNTVSDASGGYLFTSVPIGTYICRIVVPTGWVQEAFSDYRFTLGTDVQISGIDIGTHHQPVANLGGPYSVGEGGHITLDGTASSEAGGTIVSYQWQTTYFSNVYTLASGPTTTFYVDLGQDGPSTQQIQLTVTDAAGTGATVTGTVTITNVAPTATFNSGGSVTLGSDGSVAFTNPVEHSLFDRENLYYSYDFNNDGTFDVSNSINPNATVLASYLSTTGSHTIRGRIADKDGGFTDYTTTITVTAASTGTITGTVYNDANGNGVKDAGETAVSGQKMFLDLNRDAVLQSTEPTFTTGANGVFTFSGLAAGTYRVRMIQLSGYAWTAPTSGYYEVPVAAGQTATTKDYLEKKTATLAGSTGSPQAGSTGSPLAASPTIAAPKATISGTVFRDTNANGRQDTGEKGLAGWLVYLDLNNDGRLDTGDLRFTTDSRGHYTFTVKAGKYVVRQLMKSGFRRSAPAAGAYSITLAAGQSVSGKNFGNHR